MSIYTSSLSRMGWIFSNLGLLLGSAFQQMSMIRCRWWLTNLGMRGRAFSLAIWEKEKRRQLSVEQDPPGPREDAEYNPHSTRTSELPILVNSHFVNSYFVNFTLSTPTSSTMTKWEMTIDEVKLMKWESNGKTP